MIQRFVFLFSLLLPVMAYGADAVPNQSLLNGMQARAASVVSIRSNFTEEKHLKMFDSVLVSKGVFAFRRPDSLRWEYTSPFRSGFLLSGGNGVEWDDTSDAVREVSVHSSPLVAMIAQQIMAWTTFDISWLEERYLIRQVSAHPLVLELHPRSELAKEFLANLVITFAEDGVVLHSLELHETDGDFTRISFDQSQLNTSLPDTTFTSVQ
ncbi:outer membrane lipoprotein carrier protein LolA [Desulfovibrio sp. Huiquan2017]|uniref:LolA family protein n=1 Tax=Desulfovibrio sp. Huiquan2017 TaxID=2816861 RepID=UPI001A928E73|nr:outer membrane lipoprotein carrier protein LolA [Desulfovibrio sp. Huiquan2017]